MIEYRLSTKKIILTLLGGTIFLFVFFSLHKEKIPWEIELLMSFLLIFTGISIFFIGKRLYKLRIDEENNTVFLFYRKYLFFAYSEVILFKSLTFSYKEEVGAQGVKSQEFRIYVENKKLFGIDRALDGWKTKAVNEIVSKFRELGLNEKI
jgi:hypothetical protein